MQLPEYCIIKHVTVTYLFYYTKRKLLSKSYIVILLHSYPGIDKRDEKTGERDEYI